MTSGLFIGVSESLCDALGSSGARPRIIHDGGTPDRHCMLLSHTGIQLLCPACGGAVGFLLAPSALLLCCTAPQPCAFQRLKKNKNKKRGFPFYMEAFFGRG